jgi:hypothetical protein
LELANGFTSPVGLQSIEAQDADFLNQGVIETLFYAMSFATEHDKIILLGKVIEAFPSNKDPGALGGTSGAAMAAVSFLRAQAYCAATFLFMLQIAINLGCKWATPAESGRTRLETFLESNLTTGQECRSRFATLGLQWMEVLSWVAQASERCPSSFEI